MTAAKVSFWTLYSLNRYHRCGDIHHPLHAGVPDSLHVPPQGDLPHQWGKGSGVVRVRWCGHHRDGAALHRDHWGKQEGMVYLRNPCRQHLRRARVADSVSLWVFEQDRGEGRGAGVSSYPTQRYCTLYIVTGLSLISIVFGDLRTPLNIQYTVWTAHAVFVLCTDLPIPSCSE